MAIVVDSSVWIDFFNGVDNSRTDRLDFELRSDTIIVADLVLTEVLQGIRGPKMLVMMTGFLAELPQIDVGGQKAALRAAENYRWLRSRGITVRKTIDALIATRCIMDGHALLFSDRDFQPFVDHLGLRDAMQE